MSISLYDVLDVAPDASAEEIRAAWRSAVADLDPTDRRFAVYNEAGRVLLDAEQRAAYDAQRAAEQGADHDERTAEGGAVAPGDPAAAAVPPATDSSPGRTRAERRAAKQSARKRARDARPDGAGRGPSAARPGRVVPLWALAALAVALVALVSVSVYLVVAVPSDDAVEDATSEAQSAAERAIVPVLSYDYRSLDEDGEAAREQLTDDYYAEKYEPLFAQVKETAPQEKAVVRTEVVASGLVRSGEDQVEVLLFVDRPTRNKKLEEPVVYKDQARVTMEKVGDRWLVDRLCTTSSCGS